MQFFNPTTIAVLLCALTSYAAPAPSSNSTPIIGPLEAWKVTGLEILAPATDRNNGSIDISFAVENPNSVTAGPSPHAAGGGYFSFMSSKANCTLAQVVGARPRNNSAGMHYKCTPTKSGTFGIWSVRLASATRVNGTRQAARGFDPSNVNLAFTLNYNVTRNGQSVYKKYTGTGHFKAGVNLDGGCDDDGNCSYGLTNGTVLVQPKLSACRGTCSANATSSGS